MIIEDLNMYYSNAWCYDRETNKGVMVTHIRAKNSTAYGRISAENSGKFVTFSEVLRDNDLIAEVYKLDSKGMRIISDHIPTARLEVSWPKTGLINFDNFVFNVSRVSQRSVMKGVSQRTIHISDLCPELISFVGSNKVPPVRRMRHDSPASYAFVAELYNPKYYTVEEALKMLEEGSHFSVALNNRVALSFVPNYNKFGVFLYDKLVGSYSPKNKSFNLLAVLRDNTSTVVEAEICSVLGVSYGPQTV